MFEGITAAKILTTSPWVLLALTFYLIMRGYLVPRSTLEDMKEDRNAWRDAHGVSETARAEQTAQVADLLDALQTVEQLIRALPRQQGRGGR